MTITVAIADDQPLVRAGLRMIIDAADGLRLIAEATNGKEAVEAARHARPDVLLMDIRMPVLDGLEATRQITAIERPPRVLVLTTFELDEYIYGALKAGASGFLLKDVAPEHLVNGIKTVASGDSLLSPSVTTRLIESFLQGQARTPAASTRQPDAPRAGDLQTRRPRPVQHRDRRSALPLQCHRQDTCHQSPDQAAASRPRPGRSPGLRDSHRPARRTTMTSGPHRAT